MLSMREAEANNTSRGESPSPQITTMDIQSPSYKEEDRT